MEKFLKQNPQVKRQSAYDIKRLTLINNIGLLKLKSELELMFRIPSGQPNNGREFVGFENNDRAFLSYLRQ